MRQAGMAAVLTLLMASCAWAAELTVKEIIDLKRIGYADAELIAEINKAGAALNPTDEQIAQLKQLGAGQELIIALRAKPVTLEEVVVMCEAKRPVDDILDAIANSPRKPKVGAAESVGLARKGVPVPVLMALSGQPLGKPQFLALAAQKAEVTTYQKLAGVVGYTSQEFTMAEARELHGAGVPAEVLKQQMDVAKAAAAVAKVEEAPKPKVEEAAKPPVKRGNDGEKDPLERPAPTCPPAFVGQWAGVMGGPMGVSTCAMRFDANGHYLFQTREGVVQQGKWYVIGSILYQEPDLGMTEQHAFTLSEDGGQLTIKGALGSLRLNKQR